MNGSLDFALSRLKSAHPNPTAGPRPMIAAKNFASSQIFAGKRVYGQAAGVSAIYTQPQFYSPLHTPQNWQIPIRRREIYQWCSYWYENDTKVGSAIDFYSTFPMNGFETQCHDFTIKKYFDHLNKKLNLDFWVKMISQQYYIFGDVFPFLEIECPECHGRGVTEDGEICEHEGGSFRRLVVLNPHWIDVQTTVLADEPVVTLVPDDELKRIVWHKQPPEIYNRIPPHIRSLILSGRPIPLSNECVSHIRYNPYPFSTYGISPIRRLFKTLMYRDKLMTAQWIVSERLILPIRIVKVGDVDRPAGPSDIADIQQQLASVANDPNLTLVTHHALEYDWHGTNGKVLQLSNEYDLINKELLQGLMINEALLSGEMAGYASAAIGAESLIQRIESWRLDLGRWIEDKIYKPVAKMKGFIDEDASKDLGEEVYIYPKILWNDLNLRDDTQQKQLWLQLYERQVMSMQSLCEKFNLDYDQEVERIRLETASQQFGQQAPGGAMGAMGGMPPMGGAEMGGAPPMGGPAPGAPPPPGMAGPEMGGMPAGPMPGAAASSESPLGGTGSKILSKGKKAKKESELNVPKDTDVQPAMIRLTKPEQEMYRILASLPVPFRRWPQFPLGPYHADFAIPDIRLDIECDGDYWHAHPETRAKDEQRDLELSKYGWTTIRFRESTIKEHPQEVQKELVGTILRCWRRAYEQQQSARKQASSWPFAEVEKSLPIKFAVSLFGPDDIETKKIVVTGEKKDKGEESESWPGLSENEELSGLNDTEISQPT